MKRHLELIRHFVEIQKTVVSRLYFVDLPFVETLSVGKDIGEFVKIDFLAKN
jgi:hypothetical protein